MSKLIALSDRERGWCLCKCVYVCWEEVEKASKNKAAEPCVWCQIGLRAVLVSLWLDFYLPV